MIAMSHPSPRGSPHDGSLSRKPALLAFRLKEVLPVPGSLVARDISKSFAAVQVLDRISLVVAPGDRVGVVGPNGIGKSTLLRVLAGLEEPDRGRVVRSGAVGYLPQ